MPHKCLKGGCNSALAGRETGVKPGNDERWAGEPRMNTNAGRAVPVEADMADGNPTLLQFASRAGSSLLSVIPEATKHKAHVKGPARIHYICDPGNITRILVSDARAFPKSQVTRNILGSAIGNGMILSEGQTWKDQRRRYAPLFAARGLPDLARVFAATGQRLGTRFAEQNGVIDVSAAAQDASLADISQVMFSGSDTVSPDAVQAGLKRYTAYVADMSLFDLLGLPAWIPRLKWLKSTAPVTRMRGLARDVITARLARQTDTPQDFLDLMVATLHDDPETMDQTVDNLLTFVVAGHETAANTLTWVLYLLALYPDMQDALRREVATVSGHTGVAYADLEKMPLLDAHVAETLRLYPAAAFFARDVAEDRDLDGISLTRGDAVFLPIYAIHRHSRLWDAPDEYRPERFRDADLQRGQYLPFGDGPRVCIGAAYAKTEIKILLASILQRARIAPSDRPVPKPVVTITMHPAEPLFLEVVPL